MEEQGQRGAARKKPTWTRAAESELELTATLGPQSPVQQGWDADAGGEAGWSPGEGARETTERAHPASTELTPFPAARELHFAFLN